MPGLDTKQGQNGNVGLKAQPYINLHRPGGGDPCGEEKGQGARPLPNSRQTNSGGGLDRLGWASSPERRDLDGQAFTVWPWRNAFCVGPFRRPGNAAISIGRGNGKSAFVAALATAVVAPGGPLHGTRREVICVASSFLQSRIIFEDVLAYARGLGMTWPDGSLWRLQNSQNVATLEYVQTGARVR